MSLRRKRSVLKRLNELVEASNDRTIARYGSVDLLMVTELDEGPQWKPAAARSRGRGRSGAVVPQPDRR